MYRPTYINIHQTCSAASAPWNVSAELLQPGLGPRRRNPSLPPWAREGSGSRWAAAALSPSSRFRSIRVCLGDEDLPTLRGTSAQAVCCCQPWSHPHSLQIQTCKAVNKSTLRGRCYLVLQAGLLFCWAPREARGSQGLENKLCSTAGWALPRCHCSFHNSPEVRRARRGRREREEHSKQRVSTVPQPSLQLLSGREGPGPSRPACGRATWRQGAGGDPQSAEKQSSCI